MTRIAQPVPVGSLLVDTVAPISASDALVLARAGVKGVWRYGDTLTSAEIDGLHAAGLGVLLCFYADDFDGVRHTTRAGAIGYSKSCSIATDLESEHETADIVFAKVDLCGAQHQAGGYQSALYEGCEQPLNGDRLYRLPHVDHYWRSASWVEEPACGYCCYQLRGASNVHFPGVSFLVDLNMTELDKRGRSLTWCVAA